MMGRPFCRVMRLTALLIVIVAVGAGLVVGVPRLVEEVNCQQAEQALLTANQTAIPRQRAAAQALRQTLPFAPITPSNARQLSATLRFEAVGQYINDLVWSPDGARVAVGYEETTDEAFVLVWDALISEEPILQIRHPEAVRAVAWSPDGTRLVLVDMGTLAFIDPVRQTLSRVSVEGLRASRAAVWLPDGATVAIGETATFGVALWDVATRQLVRTSEKPLIEGTTPDVISIAWSPDGLRLASGDANDTVIVWAIPRE